MSRRAASIKHSGRATTRAGGDGETLRRRRLLLLALTLSSLLGLALLAWRGLQPGRDPLRLGIWLLFLLGLPWSLLGLWNSLIGFVILRTAGDPAVFSNPALAAALPGPPAPPARTALCVAIRHEEVASVLERLASMANGLRQAGLAGQFDLHVLSDSSDDAVIATEEAGIASLRSTLPGWQLDYRRRPTNLGYKAGNLAEFARTAVERYEFMVVLDADSLLGPRALARLVRVMQANPRLAILQTLVVGRPAGSAFARIFQFGMRHSMLTHTTGIAWWQGPSGPYWGHNAIIRLGAYVTHAALPLLPGGPPLGGHIMSHDQVEAALLQAAGWHVRVIADELESSEENPPSLPDFIRRDLRWAQGNMQYLKLVARRGFNTMGRLQLANAIMMYMGAPAWVLMLVLGLGDAGLPAAWHAPFRAGAGAAALYFTMLAIGTAPRLLGAVDAALDPRRRQGFGGLPRLACGMLLDTLFSFMLGPVMAISQARFLAGLPFGRRLTWERQRRRSHAIGWREALSGLWPHTLFGVLLAAGLAREAPAAIPWALPALLSCLLSVPFAVLTASPGVGRLLARWRLCTIPEEQAAREEQAGRD